MLYSMVPASFLIISLILNREYLKSYGLIERKDDKRRVQIRHNQFILFSVLYFLVDMLWGLLYEHNDLPQTFPYIYLLTVFYFLFMLLTMLTWTRYIVAYLDKSGWRTKLLLYGVWVMVIIGLICLILNRFYHFMFSYNEAHEFIGETGRNLSFLLQIAFYAVVTINMLYVTYRSVGQQKVRYKVVAATSFVLGVFLIFQICYYYLPSYAIGLMLGIILVHTFVLNSEKKEKEIYKHIASAMAEDYEAIFYIEIETGEYMTYAKSEKHESLNASATGKDFYGEALSEVDRCVYYEDREYAKSFYDKETVMKKLDGRRSFSYKYRLMINGEPRFFLFTVMRESSGRYYIFYEKDIEDELNAEKMQKENQKKTVTFSQIADSLASNYDVIYYVDVKDSSYVGYEGSDIYGKLDISKEGEDFFADCYENIPQIVHKQDCKKLVEFLDKDNMIFLLDNRKDLSIDYRVVVGGKSRYTRMIARKTSDGTHFIICVEDINAEVLKEKRQLKALKSEKELARRDELTGVKNKTAYLELEKSVQGNIDNGLDYLPFALVVCDTNNLKLINDTKGHAAGDEYIKASAGLICDIFSHSPVFRVGGDEFVVFLREADYNSRDELMDKLRKQVLENKKTGEGVVMASGMSEYRADSDCLFMDVFERADKEMYDDKQSLKS